MDLNLEGALKQLNESSYYICDDVKEDIEKILKVLCGEKTKVVKTYRIGQRFEVENVSIGEGKYLLARVGSYDVCLVHLTTGQRWSAVMRVNNVFSITENEFKCLTGDGEFTLVEEGGD